MSYVLKKEQQLQILRLLAEGNSLSGTARLTRVHPDTCTRLMVRFGQACQAFLDREIQDLQMRHPQVDELWTFCRKKDRKITGQEPDPDNIGSFFLFFALDHDSRLIPSHWVGRRDQPNTNHFVSDLAGRFQFPRPHASDRHANQRKTYMKIVRISTYGFPAYESAIDAAFGPYADYAQVIKKETKKDGKKELTIKKRIIKGEIKPEDISTSLAERLNLTSRTFMKRLVRRTTCFSKKLENLRAACAMQVAHYNYCWKVKTLRTTPAFKAGLCGSRWTINDLYNHVQACSPTLIWS